MLPRELIEELVAGCGATRLHILVALADGIDSFLIILALPLEVVGQRVVERVSRIFPRRRARSSSCANRSGLRGTVSIS